MDYRFSNVRNVKPVTGTRPSFNLFLYVFLFLILLLAYSLIAGYFQRKRDKEWEQRLQPLADHLTQRLQPLQARTPPSSHGVPELVAWRGLRYGTGLGFGAGVTLWFGVANRSRVESLLALLMLWWVLWRRRDEALQQVLGDEEATLVFEMQATVFGVVLGVGLAFAVGAGLSFQWPLEWIVVLCLIWALVWSTWGAGVTWSWRDRRVRFECIQVGGFGRDHLAGGISGARRTVGLLGRILGFAVVGTIWLLARLFRGLISANAPEDQEEEHGVAAASEAAPDNTNQSHRSASKSPGPEPAAAQPGEDPAAQLIDLAPEDTPLPGTPPAEEQEEEVPSRRPRRRSMRLRRG